ncbi:MBL fold metallo-hydrolase [Paenibacillus lautus]|nr:MBL fold metallo-hydrolase [Paenibacillus lautus]MBX4148434.1 MBL fold metallo-hydrolase [Paenibacillus lautus]
MIDAGIPYRLPVFQEVMAQAGIPLDKLKKIILTHHDLDHIGGLTELLNAIPHKIDILATEEEKPYIQGENRCRIDPDLIRSRPQNPLQSAFRITKSSNIAKTSIKLTAKQKQRQLWTRKLSPKTAAVLWGYRCTLAKFNIGMAAKKVVELKYARLHLKRITAISVALNGNGLYDGTEVPVPSACLRNFCAANRCRSVYDERCPNEREADE